MKNICNSDFLDMLLEMLIDAPVSDIDPKVKNDIVNFKNENHTYAEKYDFIVELSKLPNVTVSSFIVALCQLDEHYLRPLN